MSTLNAKRAMTLRQRATLAVRDANLAALPRMSDRELLGLLWRSRGVRAHPIGCGCGGVNDRTGLACNELWLEVGSRVEELGHV